MKKIFCLVLMLLCMASSCFAVEIQGWDRTEFPGILEFQYPPTLQLREPYEKIKADTEAVKSGVQKRAIMRFGPNQAMGGKYAKVQVRVQNIKKDLGAFGQPIQLTQEDIQAWQGEYLADFANSLGHTIELTNPAEFHKVSGNNCVYMEYHYKGKDDNMEWYDYIYQFYDRGRVYRVRISVRADEYKYWTRPGTDIRHIVTTLKPLG